MKRILIALLTVILLLTGCTSDPSETTAPSVTDPVPAQPGLYDPDAAVEKLTKGAVKAYGAAPGGMLLTMGNDILLFTCEDGVTVIQRLTGQNAAPVYTACLEEQLPVGVSLQVQNNALAYYSPKDNGIVFLDGMLQHTEMIPLPEGIAAPAVISSDLTRAYYSLDGQVRYLNLATGISSLLRDRESDPLIPVLSASSDERLLCRREDGSMEYISAADGRTLETAEKSHVTAFQDAFFATVEYEEGVDYLFGRFGKAPLALYPYQNGICFPLLSHEMAMALRTAEEGVEADLYDLNTGRRIATQPLSGLNGAHSPMMDEQGNLWFTVWEGETEILCRWDWKQSACEDAAVYSGERITAENPDSEGLAACAQRLQTLSEAYGLNLRLWDSGEAPAGYSFQRVYRAEAANAALDSLEQLLSLLPRELFAQLEDGRLTVELVRRIKADALDADPEGGSLAYWIGGEGRIALVCGADVKSDFCAALSNILDAHIYAGSLKYDDWNALNPKGFAYDGSYGLYESRDSRKWLEGTDRAFVDSYSMTFAREDRGRIFACAMEEGCEEVFASAMMQKKLQRICDAIRDAFGWETDERVFPWEQYLKK